MEIKRFVDKEKVVYLAGPFSSDLKVIEKHREVLHDYYTYLIYDRYNQPVFGPITQSGRLSKKFGLSGKYDYWKAQDRAMVKKCDAVWVMAIDGWEDSIGVEDELALAKELGKQVLFIEERDEKLYVHEGLSIAYGTLRAEEVK
jgi:hypothetical protein